MNWPFNLFGSQPEQVRKHEADEAFEQHGRRLNERRWRDHMEFIGSL